MNTTDKDYLDFLRLELPRLRTKKIPFLSRTFFPRNDTLRHTLRMMDARQSGLILEFGVWKGGTINMIGRKFKSSTVFGFDSFTGFPDDGRADWTQDFSLAGNLPKVRKNVRLIQGYFDETLPIFIEEHKDQHISFIHIDCDIYSSTKTIFDLCEPLIRPSCIVVFDELLHYSRFLENEMLALYEFTQTNNYEIEWLGIRDKVLGIEEFLKDPIQSGPMKNWRKDGYYQEVSIKLVKNH